MLPSIFDSTRTTDASTHRAVLEHRLRVIDQRRAEIESLNVQPDTERGQALQTELSSLNGMRAEIDHILHPRAQPPRHPALDALYTKQRIKDKKMLAANLQRRTRETIAFCESLEQQGDHRQAAIHRLTIPQLPELIIKELGFDPALIAEIED